MENITDNLKALNQQAIELQVAAGVANPIDALEFTDKDTLEQSVLQSPLGYDPKRNKKLDNLKGELIEKLIGHYGPIVQEAQERAKQANVGVSNAKPMFEGEQPQQAAPAPEPADAGQTIASVSDIPPAVAQLMEQQQQQIAQLQAQLEQQPVDDRTLGERMDDLAQTFQTDRAYHYPSPGYIQRQGVMYVVNINNGKVTMVDLTEPRTGTGMLSRPDLVKLPNQKLTPEEIKNYATQHAQVHDANKLLEQTQNGQLSPELQTQILALIQQASANTIAPGM